DERRQRREALDRVPRRGTPPAGHDQRAALRGDDGDQRVREELRILDRAAARTHACLSARRIPHRRRRRLRDRHSGRPDRDPHPADRCASGPARRCDRRGRYRDRGPRLCHGGDALWGGGEWDRAAVLPITRIAAALVLAVIAVRGVLQAARVAEREIRGPIYLIFLTLTLLNPPTVIYFVSLAVALPEIAADLGARAAFVAGAFLASLSWQELLA